MLILGERHLRRALAGYVRHYNEHRPHRGLDLTPPRPPARPPRSSTSPSSAEYAAYPSSAD
jgi:transposase InsO family protein